MLSSTNKMLSNLLLKSNNKIEKNDLFDLILNEFNSKIENNQRVKYYALIYIDLLCNYNQVYTTIQNEVGAIKKAISEFNRFYQTIEIQIQKYNFN